MEVSYSQAVINLDQPALDAQAERPDRPLRLRIQPTLLRQKAGQTIANHQSWPGVSWTLECQTADEAIQVRKALTTFLAALNQHGAVAVDKALTGTLRVR